MKPKRLQLGGVADPLLAVERLLGVERLLPMWRSCDWNRVSRSATDSFRNMRSSLQGRRSASRRRSALEQTADSRLAGRKSPTAGRNWRPAYTGRSRNGSGWPRNGADRSQNGAGRSPDAPDRSRNRAAWRPAWSGRWAIRGGSRPNLCGLSAPSGVSQGTVAASRSRSSRTSSVSRSRYAAAVCRGSSATRMPIPRPLRARKASSSVRSSPM